ncbi:MAG: hypothetical protein ACI9LY_000169 [Arenicella sp.]|jgi:hypothetical protein
MPIRNANETISPYDQMAYLPLECFVYRSKPLFLKLNLGLLYKLFITC